MILTQRKAEQLLRVAYVMFAVFSFGVMGITFGLSVYTATVLEGRVKKARDDKKELQDNVAQRTVARSHTTSMPQNQEDTLFLEEYRILCSAETSYEKNMKMNQPGGFTRATNCPAVALTFEWLVMSSIDRNRLCQSYRAYSANNYRKWGHCKYSVHTESCEFADVTQSSLLADPSGCTDLDATDASETLVNSASYPHSSNSVNTPNQFVVVSNNNAYNWLF